MPFPGGTYLAQIVQVGHRVADEFDQLYALFEGYLRKEHKEDGSHSAITADSVTVTGNVTVNGNVIGDGTGVFDGNVTADADGQPAVLGYFGAGLGTGVDLTNGASSRWSIVALTASVTRVLQIADLLNLSQTYVGQFGSYGSGTGSVNYSLVPEATTGITLGEDSSGKRLDQVHTKTVTASTGVTGVAVTASTVGKAATFGLTSRTAPAQITSNKDNYAISSGGARVNITSDAARDITGIVAGFDGQFLFLINIGGFSITLKHNSGSSSAGNQILGGGSADVVLRSNGSVLLHYDATRAFWYVLGA